MKKLVTKSHVALGVNHLIPSQKSISKDKKDIIREKRLPSGKESYRTVSPYHSSRSFSPQEHSALSDVLLSNCPYSSFHRFSSFLCWTKLECFIGMRLSTIGVLLTVTSLVNVVESEGFPKPNRRVTLGSKHEALVGGEDESALPVSGLITEKMYFPPIWGESFPTVVSSRKSRRCSCIESKNSTGFVDLQCILF